MKRFAKNTNSAQINHSKQIETKKKKTFNDYWNEMIKALIATK